MAIKFENPEIVIERSPAKFDYYTSDDEDEFIELIKKDNALALFLYSRNVLTKDGIKHLEESDKSARTIARGGEMYVPVSFFKEFLGVKTALNSGDGYLPLIKTCSELGVFAKTYNDGLLAVVGGVKLDEEIKKNPRLVYAGGYATLGKYDASKFTKEDYRAAKERFREVLVGSSSINDMNIPEFRGKIREIEEICEKKLAIFHRSEDAVILFGDKPAKDSVDLAIQYGGLYHFARAYAAVGSKYYHDPQLLSDILFGLEWMYLHMYGEAEIEERGWRSARDYDWYHWFVGGPDPLTDIMLLVEDHLTMEQKKRYLKCFFWVLTFMRNGYFQNCATSRIKVCTKAALLLEDAEWMEREFYDYDLLCEINEEGEGAHIDYVQWTHNFPYNLVYGNNNLSRVLFIGALLGGTPVEYTSPKQYNLFKLAKYMFAPVHYKGRGAIAFVGRGMGATEYTYGTGTVQQLLPMVGLFGEDEDNYIKRLIKRNSVNSAVRAEVMHRSPLPELKKYLDILKDDSIPYIDDYEIGHAYFTGDRAVQQRNDYSFVISLSSDRHPAYESINGSHKLGWYTGDGAVYLSTNNDTDTFAGDNFANNEKVMMNVPGTTVDTQKRTPWSHKSGIKGSCDFVGCISANEKFVTAAMDYKAYDYHGETEPPVDKDYGGGFIPHTNDLTAKKAYFLLDKECVCLGAGITSATGFPVKTVVEDRNLVINGDGIIGRDRTAIDGKALDISDFEETVYNFPSYASLENVGGYVFLEKGNVSAEKFSVESGVYYKEGGGFDVHRYEPKKRFFKLCIEHGKNPKNASYAYATIPYAKDTELAAYAASSEVEIISNTPECQALRKESIGFASYIFYSRGACEEIEVSEPCIVTVLKSFDKCEISVCDPTQKLEGIDIKINKPLKPLNFDGNVTVNADGELVRMTVNTVHSVGRPYRALFEAK